MWWRMAPVHFIERATLVDCHGASMLAILSIPEQAGPRGVLVIVGGPQYRVGSHRQFALLARDLARSGIATMRFDYRGMGDSEGDPRNFRSINDDIQHALDAFLKAVPALREVVIWGLCDAATAALFYAHRDSRVTGLALLNPWVRTEQGAAGAYLRNYYLSRLIDHDLWRKLLAGKIDLRRATSSFLATVRKALRPPTATRRVPETGQLAQNAPLSESLPEQAAEGLSKFRGKVLLILSGDDLTASEFKALGSTPSWRALLSTPRVTRRDLAQANHTFSRREWRDEVSAWTVDWVKSW